MSAPKPTTEHIAEAERIWRVWSGSTSPDGPTMPDLIASAIAAAEERGADGILTPQNERGKGAPPVPGFVPCFEFMRSWEHEDNTTGHIRACRVRPYGTGWRFSWALYGDPTERPWPTGEAPTARACMRAAWAALEAFNLEAAQ